MSEDCIAFIDTEPSPGIPKKLSSRSDPVKRYGIESETQGFQPSDIQGAEEEPFVPNNTDERKTKAPRERKSGQLIETLKRTLTSFFEQIS